MFFRFLLVGGLGFCIDVSVTYLLILLGTNAWLSRIPAIMLAMLFTWLANRYFTYKVDKPRSTNEAFRYILVAIFMALVNYFIYVVLVSFELLPVIAITIATACQTVISFRAYKYFVFTSPSSSLNK